MASEDDVINSVLNSAVEFLASAVKVQFAWGAYRQGYTAEGAGNDGAGPTRRRERPMPPPIHVEETRADKDAHSQGTTDKDHAYSQGQEDIYRAVFPITPLDTTYADSPVRIQRDIDSVLGAMQDAYDFEAKRRDERLRQARLSFNAALVLLIIGTLVVLAGVVLLFRNQNITAGIATSGAGVISNFFSAILFKFSRDANDRLDKIKTNLAKIEAYQQALTAISENRKAAKK